MHWETVQEKKRGDENNFLQNAGPCILESIKQPQIDEESQ